MHSTCRTLEVDLVPTFETKNFSSFIGRCHRLADAFDDLPRPLDLLGVRFCELTFTRPKTIFQAHANIRAHGGGLGGDTQLTGTAPRTDHR
jgi:hypothetical protein